MDLLIRLLGVSWSQLKLYVYGLGITHARYVVQHIKEEPLATCLTCPHAAVAVVRLLSAHAQQSNKQRNKQAKTYTILIPDTIRVVGVH